MRGWGDRSVGRVFASQEALGSGPGTSLNTVEEHTYNPSPREVEAGGLGRVLGYLQPHSPVYRRLPSLKMKQNKTSEMNVSSQAPAALC